MLHALYNGVPRIGALQQFKQNASAMLLCYSNILSPAALTRHGTNLPLMLRQCKQAPQRQSYSVASLLGGCAIGKQRPLMPSSQKCPFHSAPFLARTTASSDKNVPYTKTLVGAGELLQHDRNTQLGKRQRTCRLW